MKKTWKKTLSVFLTLSMVAALAPATAWAEETGGIEPTQAGTALVPENENTGDNLEEQNTDMTETPEDTTVGGAGANDDATVETGDKGKTDADGENTDVESDDKDKDIDEEDALAPTESEIAPFTLMRAIEAADVAKIGEDGYATLEAAVNAATNGDTITLLDNIVLEKKVTVKEKDIILDLDGKTITPDTSFTSNGLIWVDNKATLTIDDTTGNGSIDAGENPKVYAAVIVWPDGYDTPAKLVVNAGTLKGYYYGISGNGTGHGTEITINGGEIIGTNGAGIYHPQDGTMTIKDGEITGENTAVEFRSGTLNITGGTFTATAEEYKEAPNGNGTSVIGAALAISQHTTEKKIEVTIEGGTFKGAYALSETKIQNGDNTKDVEITSISDGTFEGDVKAEVSVNFISGGDFSKVPPETAVKEDMVRVQKENGEYTVATQTSDMVKDEETGIYYESETAQEANNQAKIVTADGTKYYKTLVDAVAAAENGATITLLKDCEGAGIGLFADETKGTKVKNLIFDFGGKTYTCVGPAVGSTGTENQAMHFEEGCDITLKNGTLKVANTTELVMGIQNYCNLTLENFNVDASENANCAYAMSNNNGDVLITGNSSITAAEGKYAFDVCVTTNYPDGTRVTVDTTGTIKGDIQYDVWTGVPTENKTKLDIKNGTFVGEFVVDGRLTEAAKDKIDVYGGEYSASVDPEYLAAGLNYEAENADGMFTYHKNISEAQAAAGEGGTITQVKDADGNVVTDQPITVTIDNKNGDKVTELKVASGGKINVDDLAVPTKNRYRFRGWTVDGKAVSGEIEARDDMVIEASWKKKSSSSSSSSSSDDKTYTVSKADVENGKVKVDPTKAEKGDKVTITVTPDKGYEINKVRVTDADGNKIDLKDKGNGEYTFTMPDSKVEVKATFSKAEETPVEPEVKTIVLTINQLAVSIFGETKINDVAPIIRNDRTMLPIRLVAEALGATVAWDAAQNKVTITKDELVIEIFIGSPFAKVNGNPVQLDSPAFIENSRTYLPIRFVAENLGADVAWDQATQQVTITPNK